MTHTGARHEDQQGVTVSCERAEVPATTVQGNKTRRAANSHTNRNGRDRRGRR